MARPRQKKNLDLPANLYRNDDSFRYRRPDTGTWHGMGQDKAKAVAAARKLNSMLIVANDNLIAKVLGQNQTFGEFIEYYKTYVLAPKNLSKNSMDQYKTRINQYVRMWENKPIDQITLKMINEFLDTLTNSASNQARSKLIDILNHAVAKGLCPDNQAALTIAKPTKKQRKRHTLEGLAAIRNVCDDWLKNAIDLSMLTTQRRSDILKIKWDDIKDGWIYIAQEKTTESSDDEFEELIGAGYIRIKIDSEIQAVLNRCKASNIISPFVIHRKPKKNNTSQRKFKEHWTSVELDYLSDCFRDARNKANPYPNFTTKQQPGFHEIRALSIHLYKQMGRDPQALAGHENPETTEIYASGHGNIVWNDVEVGLKLPF